MVSTVRLLPPKDYSVVYSIMKTVQKIISKTSQVNTAITFGEAIYCKLKQIQWRFSDELVDSVIKMGGFHIAITFLAVISEKYEVASNLNRKWSLYSEIITGQSLQQRSEGSQAIALE